MKLYAFQPDGHGKYSFFVMAESEQQAKEAIDKYVAEVMANNDCSMERYECDAWPHNATNNYYTLTIAEPGQVITNSNE